jgi:two-component system, chemotaxis family, response regulator Rcp1
MNMPSPPLYILLVEDSPSDVFLTTEALQQTRNPPHVDAVPDGVEALAFLRREGAYASAPRPDIVLLDLNMPRKDGREVLAEIKSDPDLQSIPVIVLTSSGAEQDISRAYDLRANCYIIKPVDFTKFKQLIGCLEEFWFVYVSLPRHQPQCALP